MLNEYKTWNGRERQIKIESCCWKTRVSEMAEQSSRHSPLESEPKRDNLEGTGIMLRRMKMRWILLSALVLVSQATYAVQQEYEDAMDFVASTTGHEPGALPAPGHGCGYAPKLLFTLDVTVDQTMRDYFDRRKTAISVVTDWNRRAGAIQPNQYGPDVDVPAFQAQFGALVQQVAALRPGQADPPFVAILEARHRYDKLPAITELLNLGFRFPLFEKGSLFGKPSMITRMVRLKQQATDHDAFLDIHTGRESGGFGNMSLHDLFFTPSTPKEYSDENGRLNGIPGEIGSKVGPLITLAQDNYIIPKPELAQPCAGGGGGRDGSAKSSQVSAPEGNKPTAGRRQLAANDPVGGAANQCCCNTSAHGSKEYHTCATKTGPDCNMCGTSCCVAGVFYCTSASDHQHN